MITNYNISFNTWLANLIQWFDAGVKSMAWLRVLISSIKSVHTQFITYRDSINREASYNSQVMVMERMLNIQYYNIEAWASPGDTTAGGHIYIVHVLALLPPNYIFYNSEAQPLQYDYYDSEAQPQEYIYMQTDYNSQVAFIVKVPAALTFSTAQMRALIDKYVPAGFNYTIITY